jgi:peptide/nickel transport system substrate-binding protein
MLAMAAREKEEAVVKSHLRHISQLAGVPAYSRREFAKRGAAIGVSLPTLSLALGTPSRFARAQGTEPSGRIGIALAAEPPSLEHWQAYSIDGHPVLRNVFEALLNRDPTTNELVGELATSWEWVDERTLRFSLREGVTYHNGDPFNAEVAAFGVTYTWSKDNNFDIIQFMGPQISAKAIDDTTLEVSTSEPDPILPARLYFAPIPNMNQVQQRPDSLQNEPIGTGPYQLTEWARGERILLSAYDNWWGIEAEDAYGERDIEEVEFVFRQESAVRAAMVSAGEVQLARFLAPEDCDSVPVCEESLSVETVFLRLDTMHPAMSDVRVREAIGLAVDKETLVDQIFGGGEVASQMAGPSALGHNENLEPLPYDVERAKELVEEAEADGVPVDAQITVAVRIGAYPRTDEFGEYVANQLNEIGLNARVEMIEHAQYQEQYVTPYEEIPADRGWIGTITHGNEMMDVSQTADGYYRCDGGVSTWCDPELDKMIDDATPLTGDERAHAFASVTEAFMDEVPVVPIVHLPLFYGLSADLQWEPRLDGFMLVKEMSID